jgi:predicted RecA/RadA family phage recombinase
MARNTVYPEADVVDVTAPVARTSGQGMLVGATLFGVVQEDCGVGDLVGLRVQGVVDLAKAAGVAVAAGERVFWVPASNAVNTTAASQVCVGVAIRAAVAGDATCRVLLGARTAAGA